MPRQNITVYTPHQVTFFDIYGEVIAVIAHIESVRVTEVDEKSRPKKLELSGMAHGEERQKDIEKLARLSSMKKKSKEHDEIVIMTISDPQIQIRVYFDSFSYEYDPAPALKWSASVTKVREIQKDLSRYENVATVPEVDYITFTIDTEAHTDLMTLAEDIYDGDWSRYVDIMEINDYTIADAQALSLGDEIRLPKS